MGLRIIEEGLLTTIQDLGRTGYQSYGFSVSGAMDPWALQLANIIVNNPSSEAVLEMSFLGPSITFEENMVISLTGADMSPKVNDRPVDLYKPIPVQRGDTLQLRTARTGLYCYLAVKGGLSVPTVLSSKSTSLGAKIGGYYGRKLQAGDLIEIHTPMLKKGGNWKLDPQLCSYINNRHEVIHFIEGRQYNWFTNQSLVEFEKNTYVISSQSDRMGYRLNGPNLELKEKRELITEGTTYGTIQVPANGQPIVLMADRQPTGGYPKIGQVIYADLPKLSQRRPNQPFTFKKCSLADARTRWFRLQKQLITLKKIVSHNWKDQ